VAKLKECQIMCAEEFVKHQSVRKTASVFNVDESTLRYHLERKRESALDGRALQPKASAEHESVILDWIRRQSQVKAGERSEPVKLLFETLQAAHGYTGSYKAVVRYVRRRTEQPKVQPFRRVETKPGAQGQADWLQKKVYVHQLGGFVKFSAFILVLSHSRMWAVVWSLGETMLCWLRCHNRAFEFLGGIPSTVRIDNLKTGVASGCGAWATLNPGYEAYASQMGFVINPHRVRTPRDKGKAERRVLDVKVLQIAEKDQFEDMEDLQKTTDLRIAARAKKLGCPVTGKSTYESWNLEKPFLAPLPPTMPEPFDVQILREVGKDSLVAFEGRRYSVPYPWAKRTVQVRGCASTVESWPKGNGCAFSPEEPTAAFSWTRGTTSRQAKTGPMPPWRWDASAGESSSPEAGRSRIPRGDPSIGTPHWWVRGHDEAPGNHGT